LIFNPGQGVWWGVGHIDRGGDRNGKRHKKTPEKNPKAQVQEAKRKDASSEKEKRALIQPG